MAKNRIKELKEQIKRRDEEELEMRNHSELFELEERHIDEFNAFNTKWDEKMNEFQIHSAQLIKALEEKHLEEVQEHREKAEDKIGDNFKASPELLNLQAIQKSLAKQEEYQEAHKVQVKANKLLAQEQTKYYNQREKKIIALENKMLNKQEKEMESLIKRIKAGEDEQKKQRAIELERMFQRYQNVKKDLENEQKRFKNSIKRGGGNFDANASRMTDRSHQSIREVRSSAKKKRPGYQVRA